jgi:hypothetical protein
MQQRKLLNKNVIELDVLRKLWPTTLEHKDGNWRTEHQQHEKRSTKDPRVA